MFFNNLIDRGTTTMLRVVASYTESRHRMLTENIANIGTPDYRARQLDVRAFQKALGDAMERRGTDPRRLFVVRVSDQVSTDDRGRLRVTPAHTPPENLLFHDRSNLSIERQMADLAENAMTHEMANTLLKGNFDRLRKAVRGRV